MARLKLAKWLYALALLAMPLSYALKDLFGLVGVTWIDPTLILGLIVFLLMGFPVKEKGPIWILALAFVSACLGACLLRTSPDRGKSSLYVYYVEPIRLALNIIWYWVSIRMLTLDKKLVLRWLAICVGWEFSAAAYLYAAFYDLVPVPDAVKLYLEIFKTRQTLSWGNIEIYRMAGTFIESPPFGLFMFCSLVVFVLYLSDSERMQDRKSRTLAVLGTICAFLGTVASLSDQMLIALLILGFAILFAWAGRTGFARKVLLSSVVAVLALYIASALSAKSKTESAFSGDPTGSSFSERSFHARYGFHLLLEQPASIVTGIGPGRYGDYAVRTGFFPSTVTSQFTLLDWIVEYGCVGLMLIGAWLFRIGSHAFFRYGIAGAGALAALLIANMFQANWMWESWFLALAFLYASVPAPEREERWV